VCKLCQCLSASTQLNRRHAEVARKVRQEERAKKQQKTSRRLFSECVISHPPPPQTIGLMDPPGPPEPVQDGIEVAAEPMEGAVLAEEQKKEPSTLPPLAEPQTDGSGAAAPAAEDLQDIAIEPAAAAPTTDGAEHDQPALGADVARVETPTPATTSTTTPIPTTPATPVGKPRPILQGSLIGLFVAIDPATQRYVCDRMGENRNCASPLAYIISSHVPPPCADMHSTGAK
jgi:hypothetical protein